MTGSQVRGRRASRLLSSGAASLLAASMLAAGTAPAAQAAVSRPAGRAAAGPGTTRPRTTSATQASARAQATGKPVIASALTTATSVTTARPGGLFTVTSTLQPTRAYRDGAWRALNPDLRVNSNKTISPAVTTGGLTLSGGGSAPLAVMTSHGRSMSLWWPGRLPVPTLSAATATYADVLPGVNLAVTVNPQGGLSEVLVIKDAAAAANPALASLRLRTAAPGLRITASPGGNLRVAASPAAEPVFTALAAQMWDSAVPAAGTAVVRGPGGELVAARSGLPAYSSAAGPGAGARVAQVPVAASGSTITLAPPRSALTARGTVYPVYIDPSFESDPVGGKAQDWTQVDSGFPTTSYWNESSDLQLGDCDWSTCNGLGVARDYIRMPISSELAKTTHVDSAYLYMTDVWSASCTAEEVDLWTSDGISSSTTWDDQPGLLTDVQNQSFAHGYSSSCPYSSNDVTWNITSVVQADAGGPTNETFGLRAGSESDDLYWKQFDSGAGNITMTTNFHNPPNKPTGLENEPAGACKTSYASQAAIGNDDITLSATVGDVDNAEGDDSLSTTFTVKSYATNDTVYTATVSSGNAAGGLTVSPAAIQRATVEGWQSNGATTAYSYYWYATTKDAGSPALTSAQSDTCYFLFNPLGPAAPGVTVSSATVQIGTTFSATLSPPSGCSATTTPCPTSFTYQMGVGTPVTVTPNNSPSSGEWTGNISMSHLGPEQLTAYGTATGGNPGATSSVGLTGTSPSTPYADGYFTGGSYPSLLTTGAGKDPSLWLSAGTGNGAVAAPVDIGSLGTMINPGQDGPADWAGAQVLHGDFTGHEVQDVMAYYPSGTYAGNAVIIGGSGDASPLIPSSGNNWSIPSVALQDPFFANPSDVPTVLVGAGDASEYNPGLDDLIGILGDPTSGYELDLFSTSGSGQCGGDNTVGGYGYCQTLSTTAPDGTADWNNYALATAQPGGNSGAVVLFALDKATGALYESVNSSCDATVTTGCGQGASSTLVGMSGTWVTRSVPWASSAPGLISADVNNAGQIELWTMSGSAAIPYVVGSSGTVTPEGTASAVAAAADDWQLNDGSADAQGSAATTATDSVTGDAATMTGGYTWQDDDSFGTVAGLDGSSSYITPPSGTIPSGDDTASLSIWFNTSIPLGSDEVLASMQADPLSSGSTTTGGYDPVLYVGTDGKLHAEFWNGKVTDGVTSVGQVNDGLWHHAVLTASGTSQSLTIDGVHQGTAIGELSVTGSPNLDFGAGYIGGGWPDETHASGSSNTGYLSYFDGELADITIGTATSVRPTAVTGTNGTTYVLVRGADGSIQEDSMAAGGSWSGLTSLGSPAGGFTEDPAALAGQGGNIWVVGVADGDLYADYLAAGSSTWSGWDNLGNPGTALTGVPAIVQDTSGTAHVFVRAASGPLYTNSVPSGSTVWSGFTDLGGNWPSDVAADVGGGGWMGVFAVGTTTDLYEDDLPPGGSWSGWTSLGTGVMGVPAVIIDAAGSDSGTWRVFVRSTSGALETTSAAAGSSTWAALTSLGGSWPSDVAAYPGSGGTDWVYAVGTTANMYYDKGAAGTWSGWTDLNGSFTGVPGTTQNSTANELFGCTTGGLLDNSYVDNGTSTWSAFADLGGPVCQTGAT
jgi:hypothetical protein